MPKSRDNRSKPHRDLDSKARDVQLKLRVRAREKLEWAQAADSEGIPLSVWVRGACAKRLKEQATPAAPPMPISSPAL